MGYLTLIYDPVLASKNAAEQEIDTLTRQIQAQQAAYTQKVAQSQEDPNRFANERLTIIRVEQSQLDREISNLAGDLVTPNSMTQILTAALQRQQGLELISISNRGATPLRSDVAIANSSESASGAVNLLANRARSFTGQVYQHGISLEFSGDFFSTLRYLQLLEQLTGGFYWDSIVFTTGEWPAATVQLELHTLSTESGFLGV